MQSTPTALNGILVDSIEIRDCKISFTDHPASPIHPDKPGAYAEVTFGGDSSLEMIASEVKSRFQ